MLILMFCSFACKIYEYEYVVQGTLERGEEETEDNMVRQHHSVDRYGLRKSTESNGQQRSTEKDDPWCGQPSIRG